MNIISPTNNYNKQAYFYADSSFKLGSISKQPNDAILVNVDYRQITPTIKIDNFSFVIDIGSNPPLMISSANVINNILSFIMSLGLPGTTYNLSVQTYSSGNLRTDTLIVDVPIEEDCIAIGTVINQAPIFTTDGMVFVNASQRYYVQSSQPSGAVVMDQWYNSVTGVLSEFVTDGTNTWWRVL